MIALALIAAINAAGCLWVLRVGRSRKAKVKVGGIGPTAQLSRASSLREVRLLGPLA